MSTIKVTNVSHPSAASPAIVLDADGDATYAGVHDFSAATVTGAPQGLVHINTTTFSAVSSVSLDDVFTSDYDNYRLIIDGVSSASSDTNLRLRVGGSDATGSSDYLYQVLIATGTSVSGASVTTNIWVLGSDSNQRFQNIADICNPFNTVLTSYSALSTRGGQRLQLGSGYHNQATSYDGFTISDNSGTITGTIRVYGYSNGA